MKKRLLSWLLVLVMVFSLIPSTLVSAWAAELPTAKAVTSVNGKTTYSMVDELPSDLSAYDIWDVRLGVYHDLRSIYAQKQGQNHKGRTDRALQLQCATR